MGYGRSNPSDRRRIRASLGRTKPRAWKAENAKEAKLLSEFLSLCSSKLTANTLVALKQEDMQKVLTALKDGQIQMEKLIELSSDEFYDLIVGQMRLF